MQPGLEDFRNPEMTRAERGAVEACRRDPDTEFRTIAAAYRVDRERLQDLFYDLYVNPGLAPRTHQEMAA